MKNGITTSVPLLILVVVAVVPGVLPSVAVLAQGGDMLARTAVVNPEDRVLNAPYSAKRRFTSAQKSADGTINRSESGGSEARDSLGRTFSAAERQWTYLEGKKSVLGHEMLYRIHDPVAKTDTKWDTTAKEVKVIHWPEKTPEGDASEAQCQAACSEFAMKPFGTDEKLGVKTFAGVVGEGTRNSYTVPSGNPDAKPIVVVHESWYCPELKIVILETNDDPRGVSWRNELVDIVRGEPDLAQYHPPANYVVHEVQFP
jgi:hypothetical protein